MTDLWLFFPVPLLQDFGLDWGILSGFASLFKWETKNKQTNEKKQTM